jgi:hypothetical protein
MCPSRLVPGRFCQRSGKGRVYAARFQNGLRPVRALVKTAAKPSIQGTVMADNAGDMKAHRETYDLVMGLLKWGTVASFLIGALVVVLIAG